MQSFFEDELSIMLLFWTLWSMQVSRAQNQAAWVQIPALPVNNYIIMGELIFFKLVLLKYAIHMLYNLPI